MLGLFPSAGFANIQPTITSDKTDYAPGSTVNLTGTTWDTAPTSGLVHIRVDDNAGNPWIDNIDVAPAIDGTISTSFQLETSFVASYTVTATQTTATGTLTATTTFTDSNPAGDLDQCANGTNADVNACSAAANPASNSWQNGNLGSSQASFLEGDSVPYRLKLTNLAAGTHTVTIGWDTSDNGRHALDYLTTYNRTVTGADPTFNAGFTPGSPTTTLPIPVDPNVHNGPDGTPSTSDDITQAAGVFTLFGGTLTGTSGYTLSSSNKCSDTSGSYAGSSTTCITISFTVPANGTNAVLAWGGHIATRQDWGPNSSAGAINGSSYHTRFEDLDGSGGNQDRSLSAAAVTLPGSITIIKDATPNGPTSFSFTGSPSPLTNFSLVDDGTAANTKVFSNITNFQTYTVNETPIPSGWAFDAVVCSVTSANGGSYTTSTTTANIAMAEGENWTCTYTNHRASGTIELKKHWVGTGGQTTLNIGTSIGGSETDTQQTGANGAAPLTTGQDTVDTGTYYVSESGGLADYSSSLACFNDNGAGAGGVANDGIKQAGEPVVSPDANNGVSVGTGDHVICTFTNTRNQGTIELKKHWVGTPSSVNLNIGTSIGGHEVDQALNLTSDGTTGQNAVDTGTYYVSEVMTNSASFTSSLACFNDNGAGGGTANDGIKNGSEPAVSPNANNGVSVGTGDHVICTFTNKRLPRIIIVKNAKPAQGVFTFDTTGSSSGSGTSWPTGLSAFTLTGSTSGGGNTKTFTVDPGVYTVKEQTQLGWILTGIGGSGQLAPHQYDCVVTGSGGSTGAGVSQGGLTPLETRTVSITIQYGDTVTCTFENTGSGATRTQGFWATHPQLATIAWFGGTDFGHTFPGVAAVSGIGDMTLCSPVTKDMTGTVASPNPGLGRLMGGFWSGISQKSTGAKRTSIDQARMQLVQQLLAAELNASAFGSTPLSGSFSAWESAYCGNNLNAIKTAQQQAASFNSQGDNTTFTPGTSADSKGAKAIANLPYWDILP